MAETQTKKENKDSEIDLIGILRIIWIGRKTIIRSMIVFLVIGVVNIIFTPKSYRSNVTLVVETNNASSGMSSILQQYGGLLGINMNKSEKEALGPDLYPEVIQSTPFLLDLMKLKVTESKFDSTITLENYIKYHMRSSFMSILYGYTVGLPGKIISWISKSKKPVTEFKIPGQVTDSIYSPIKLTDEQLTIVNTLAGSIGTEQDFKKSNKFVISVELQDPMVVAQVTSYVVKSLTKYITEYRTKKAKSDLKFVEARTTEAEARYIEAQQALAVYKDRNKNVILSSVLTEEERLQSEYDLAFSLFSALEKQLEQSKIKVQEETPVFNIMDPAQIPLKKSKPQTTSSIIEMLFLGSCIGILIILVKSGYRKLKELFINIK